jgi:hypothetical protein
LRTDLIATATGKILAIAFTFALTIGLIIAAGAFTSLILGPIN